MQRQTAASLAPGSSTPVERRFVDALQPLLSLKAPPSDTALLQEFARIIDVEDAITLSGLLGGKPRPVEPVPTAALARLSGRVQACRKRLRQAIDEQFDRDGGGERLRCLEEPLVADGLTAAQRLQRMYLRLQQEMALQLQTLRAEIQTALTELSPALARLAVLDRGVAQLIAGYQEQALAAIPRQLSRYWDGGSDGSADGPSVCRLTRQLLAAELDMRLQPVVGLVEAMEDVTGNQ